jgi:hypothetical protein
VTSPAVRGTSFAAPAIAGLAARYLQRHPTDPPSLVKYALLATGSANTFFTPAGWAPLGSTPALIGFAAADDSSLISPPPPRFWYQGQVEGTGWQPTAYEGDTIGTTQESLRLEAVAINTMNMPGVGVCYQAQVQNVGWQPVVCNGQTAGTVGQSLRMEAITISLTGTTTSGVCYRAFVQDLGWQDEVCNGQVAGTVGQSRRMEALRIRIGPPPPPPPPCTGCIDSSGVCVAGTAGGACGSGGGACQNCLASGDVCTNHTCGPPPCPGICP